MYIQIKCFKFAKVMSKEKTPYCKCLYYSANALARVITKIAEEEFAAVNLAPSYAFVVMTINKKPGIQSGELAEIMMLTPSTVTRLVDKLISQNLLKKHTEGRTVLIYPTPLSVELYPQITLAWSKIYKRYIDILGEDFAAKLTDDIYLSAIKLEKT